MNFDALYQQHSAERSRVVKALDYFQEKGWVELESKQMTEVYSLLQADFDSQALSANCTPTSPSTNAPRFRGFTPCWICSPPTTAWDIAWPSTSAMKTRHGDAGIVRCVTAT